MAGERVWLDITNSPEVLFFRPIIERMHELGVETVVTARDYAQTLGLLDLYRIPYVHIGRHGGGSVAGKALNLARRSSALARFGRGRGFTRSVSIGSNDLTVASRLLRLHCTVIQDYEGATLEHRVNFRLADKVMFPEAVPFARLARLGLDARRYRPFPGLKEQVSLAGFTPDPSVAAGLGLDLTRPIAVLRPPATMSLYNRGVHNELFDRALAHLLARSTQVVMLPRTPDQYEVYGDSGAMIPRTPVDGPALLYEADLVVSAGGSMNREAVVLGVPAWTVFAGSIGAIDQALIEAGRMRVLKRPEQIEVVKRERVAPRIDSMVEHVTQEILRR
jgi:uncharacterized protein